MDNGRSVEGTGRLVEVFASVQGEGIYLGQRQTFVRFAGCNLSCRYCDTDFDEPAEGWRLETTPGSRRFARRPNPVDADELCSAAANLTPAGAAVSLTGGEPLVQAQFLRTFLPALKTHGFNTYLETNGTLFRELTNLAGCVDSIAMDVKLPTATGGDDLSAVHTRFLAVAAACDVFVKAVITGDTADEDVLWAAGIVSGIDPAIPFVLQPVTTDRDGVVAATSGQLFRLQSLCHVTLQDVRVIPQCHRIVGML